MTTSRENRVREAKAQRVDIVTRLMDHRRQDHRGAADRLAAATEITFLRKKLACQGWTRDLTLEDLDELLLIP